MRYLRTTLLLVVASSASAQRRELTPTEQVFHVASRLTFGARPVDIERISAIGVDAWIARQLRPATIDDSAAIVAAQLLPPWSKPVNEIAALPQVVAGANYGVADTLRKIIESVTSRGPGADTLIRNAVTMLRSVTSRPTTADQFLAGEFIRAQTTDRQLDEMMADFWENHFSVYSGKQPSAGAIPMLSRDAIRPRALGTFRDLLGAVAHSPSMLYYLDNHLSKADSINENYARELLELHTLGVDGGYTQADVIAVARALTGWTIDPPRRVPAAGQFNTAAAFRFDSSAHDRLPKTVLGHALGGWRGIEDGDDVLDIVARHPSTARFIATKLVRRFVSDEPSRSLVDRAAATFTRTDGDIAEVMRTILTSDEFFSRAAFQAKVKTPFELVVSTRRVLGLSSDGSDASGRLLNTLGGIPFGRLTPDGWPDYGGAWINSGTILQRTFFASDVANGNLPWVRVTQWTGWGLYADRPAGEQADYIAQTILAGHATPSTMDALRATTGVNGTDRLRSMLALALGCPEFQRR